MPWRLAAPGRRRILRRVESRSTPRCSEGGSHLSHPRECDENDLLWLAFQDLNDRRARHPLLRDYLPEDRRLEDAEPDPQPNSHHNKAEPERDAPSPAQELIPRHLTERQDRQVCEKETRRPAKLRPRSDEPAIFARACPFHRQQD